MMKNLLIILLLVIPFFCSAQIIKNKKVKELEGLLADRQKRVRTLSGLSPRAESSLGITIPPDLYQEFERHSQRRRTESMASATSASDPEVTELKRRLQNAIKRIAELENQLKELKELNELNKANE